MMSEDQGISTGKPEMGTLEEGRFSGEQQVEGDDHFMMV